MSDNNNPANKNPGSNDSPAPNPVRLTIGHYYCSNCGEDRLSRSDARCPSCLDELRWDQVAF